MQKWLQVTALSSLSHSISTLAASSSSPRKQRRPPSCRSRWRGGGTSCTSSCAGRGCCGSSCSAGRTHTGTASVVWPGQRAGEEERRKSCKKLEPSSQLFIFNSDIRKLWIQLLRFGYLLVFLKLFYNNICCQFNGQGIHLIKYKMVRLSKIKVVKTYHSCCFESRKYHCMV